ncbi:gliding motility-associated C-terminal domain-containing protein, partial [Ascidiimonas aurantiaca]|uniref:HYR-like domain-containing protein n=1 Tax=Ascidiimonas aurantiaca TaxID=1685432 RepID=UPI0030EE7DD6
VVINDTTDPVPDVANLPDVTAQCEVTSLTPPTATDNCGGTVIVTNDATLPITAQGTTVVTWTYDDGNGNTVTQNQNVVINDTTGPAPDVANLPDVTAQCEVTSLTPPTATDNCGGTVIVTNDATLPITAQGTTVVTWTYDDGNGNTVTQNQNVVINDTTGPAPDVANLPDVTAQCEVTSLTPPTATDNCGGTVIVTNDATLPINTQGTTVVTWTYDDGNGNTTTQTQNIVINDTTDPVPDVATLPDVNSVCAVTSLTPPTGTDNCGGVVIVTSNAVLPITTQGTTVVTWTYDDGNGNTVTQNQNVVINDTTDPVPDVANLPDVTAQCEVSSLTPPTATDNCGGTVIVTSDAILPIVAQGTTVVTWTYDDGNGNTATQTQNVVIADTTRPVPMCQNISITLDLTGNASITAANIDMGSTDNCGIASISIDKTDFTCADVGTNSVLLTVTDTSNNAASCVATVTVNSPEIAVATNSGTICSEGTLQLNETSGLATSWAWSSNGAAIFSNASAQNPEVSNVTDGEIFTVVITFGTDGCTSTATTTASVFAVPDAVITNSGPICTGSVLSLEETGGDAVSWAWTSNGTAVFDNATLRNPTATGVIDGEEFTVTITDANGCINTETITVQVDPDLSPGTGTNFESCRVDSGNSLDLFSLLSGNDPGGIWSDDSGSGALSGNEIDFSQMAPGTYAFTYTVNTGTSCNEASVTVQVTLLDAIVPDGEDTQEFCISASPTVADLVVASTGVVRWYANDTGGTALPETTPLQDGQVYYAAQEGANGCESFERLAVTANVESCSTAITGFDKRAFSPNGDGVNDTFTITELRNEFPNFTMEIYNRHGMVVYKGNAQTPDWDGRSNQEGTLGSDILPNGVYYFVVEFGDRETPAFQGIVYLNR